MTTSEIKPCPCGSPGRMIYDESTSGCSYCTVSCDNASCDWSLPWYAREDLALAAWNARRSPASAPRRSVAGTSKVCEVCGCRWKVHADGMHQLYDEHQRPCADCDNAKVPALRHEMPDDEPASAPEPSELTYDGPEIDWQAECARLAAPLEDAGMPKVASMDERIAWIRARLTQPASAPSAEYLFGYSQAVLRAARERAEKEYRTTINDCGDGRQAYRNAMDAVWPIQRSPKTRDDLDRWSIEAQKEADEWSGMQRSVKLKTLGERLEGEL